MPIPKTITDEIIKFSSNNKPTEMHNFLEKQLIDNIIAPQELLDYARTAVLLEKPEKPFVIDADVINMLGFAIEKLENSEQISIEFYKLAADRGSFYGTYNYTQEIVKADPKTALIYAEKAIALSKSDKKKLQESYYVKAQCHEALSQPSDAMKTYCQIDKTFPQYKEVVAARIRLIKDKIKEDLRKQASADVGEDESNSLTRHIAESRFFNPQRSKKRERIYALAEKIIDQRYALNNDDVKQFSRIDLRGHSSREIISAEKAFQNAVIALTGEVNPKLGIPIVKEAKDIGQSDFGAQENYDTGGNQKKLISMHITHKEIDPHPHRDRFGDIRIPYLGSYNKFCETLKKISDDDPAKIKQLVEWMIRFGKKHESVTYHELRTFYPEKIWHADVHENVQLFKCYCFLIIDREQSQWLSANDSLFHLGMTVSQARCLILLRDGHLSFDDVFKNNAKYGVYSTTGMINNIKTNEKRKQLELIDDLYREKYPLGDPDTQKQAYLDLKTVYGGDSDSDTDSEIEVPEIEKTDESLSKKRRVESTLNPVPSPEFFQPQPAVTQNVLSENAAPDQTFST